MLTVTLREPLKVKMKGLTLADMYLFEVSLAFVERKQSYAGGKRGSGGIRYCTGCWGRWKEVEELKVCFESGIDNTWKDSDCSEAEEYERQC